MRRLLRWSAIGLVLAALVRPAACQIFAGDGGSPGGIVLSNFPSEATPTLVVAAPPPPPAAAPVKPRRDSMARRGLPYRAMIDAAARRVELPAQLLDAVISVESAYDPRALSSRGAIGLMQVLPATARRFGVADVRPERDNLAAGASYLRWLSDRFDGDLELMLAAYNAGEHAVDRAGRRIPDYPQTQDYVRRVVERLSVPGSEAP